MPDTYPGILDRDEELAVLCAAGGAAAAGQGAVVLVDGPAGIGKTSLLRAACMRPPAARLRILTARGLALERGFAYGIARQLIEPVRAAAGPGEWDGCWTARRHWRPGCSTGPRPARSKMTFRMPRRTACTGWRRTSRRAHSAVASDQPGESLAEAVSLLEPTYARHELALALADLGAHLRRAGRRSDAQPPLLATGARPRRTALTGPDALTSAERQVADLAAGGLTNRQIAQHLFISQATVETHLRHAFRKLGIAARADLPAQLA